jgi:membrane protein required for colicin V production
MNSLDVAVAVIVLLSVTISVVRGAVREVLYLVGWVAAFIASASFGPLVGDWVLPDLIGDALMRTLAGYVLTFLVALVLMAALAGLASKLIHKVGLGGADRLLGAVFGLCRGLLIVLLLVMLAGLTRLPSHPTWRASVTAPWLAMAVLAMKPFLPESFAMRINYRPSDAAPEK